MAARKTPVKKVSNWDKLVKEATADYKPKEPFVIDCDPPITVTPPESIERTLALATLVDKRGRLEHTQLRAYVEALCGDAFEDVWDLVRDYPPQVLTDLIQAMSEHFNGQAENESADDAPGGELDS